MRAALATALLGLLAAGCIQIPDTAAPQCYASSDCDQSAGEVCAEGVCYGDPPNGAFAVSFGPPATRTDLTSVERSSEDLPAAGFLSDLTLETPVTLTGSVTAAACPTVASMACPTGALAASVAISRPPRFAGGDGVAQSTQSTPADGDTSFTLAVPRTRPGDAAYTITVVPEDLGAAQTPGSGAAPAELVPPLRTTLSASADMPLELALGSGDLPVITGDLVDADGAPLIAYRVSALGRWAGDASDSEVSSIAYTPDGHFAIALSAGLVGPVTIVAKPTSTTAVAPTLELAGVDSQASSTHELAQPPALGNPQSVQLTVTGTGTSGAVGPVTGARVIATATATSPTVPALTAVIAAEVTVGDDGVALLPLLDGAAFTGGYHLRVVPPADSNLAVLDEDAFAPASAQRLLLPRVALQGTIVDATGAPVANVSVTARPSLHFAWALDAASQVFLAQIPAATTVTGADGDFVVFVDPTIATVAGVYDLDFEPPTGSSVPSTTVAAVPIPAGTVGPTAIALGQVALPVAANLHGRISDPDGNAVEGAELRVFRMIADPTLCALPYAPTGCAVPAQLQAHATSDADGVVRFTLPRTH